jgi:hypothetical protein
MAEMVLPVPNSPLADGARAFFTRGLKGWAPDDLSSVAPKTSRALIADGSLDVFVKLLHPRKTPAPAAAAQPAAEAAAKAAAVAAANRAEATGAEAGEWAAETARAPSVAGGKKTKKTKKNKAKKGAAAVDKAPETAADSPPETVGSSAQAPLAVV